jgi:phenylalanyl-tRNA synthetase beta subunit
LAEVIRALKRSGLRQTNSERLYEVGNIIAKKNAGKNVFRRASRQGCIEQAAITGENMVNDNVLQA